MACFITINGETRIISNTMSIISAGFHPARSYYNKNGDTLSYFKHDTGRVIARTCRRRRQTWLDFYDSPEAANEAFKKMNEGLTFQTGKWVPERRI